MFAFSAALMLAGQSLGQPDIFYMGRTVTIFSTIDHSEWCPAGNVQINLVTGEYRLVSGALGEDCMKTDLERPVKSDRLDQKRLAAIQLAYREVQSSGPDVCVNNFVPDTIVVSNSGTPILVLTNGAKTIAAPDRLQCWSDQAERLHSILSQTFRAPTPR